MYLRNPRTGQTKKRKQGFSWTTLFFGVWPALFRADWKWFGLGLLITFGAGVLTLGFGGLVYHVVAGFKYNEWHLNDLRDKGFEPITAEEFYGQRGIPPTIGPKAVPAVEPATEN